jgi:hypothetical protein
MARPAESAMQRIQVGLIGLLTVVLFAWIASMVIDRAEQKAAKSGTSGSASISQPEPVVKDEPLAELGVTPAAPEQIAPQPAITQPNQTPTQ